MTTDEIKALLPWSTPKEVMTKNGPRILSKADATESFWKIWRVRKPALRAAGVSVGPKMNGRQTLLDVWEACWWQQIDPEEQKRRKAAVEESKATDADVAYPAPEGLAYRPFQRAGIRYALARSGCLIADEMGLGKTIQAIGVVNATPNASDVLVITKAGLKFNWLRELRRWLVNPDLRDSVGIADSKAFPSTRVVIINFDIAHVWPKSLSRMWDVVIVDESHLLKNPATRRAKAICGYKPKRSEDAALARSGIPSKRKIALTGTPIENRLEELWTVLWWLDPVRFPSKWKLLKLAGITYGSGQASGPTDVGMGALQRFLRENIMIRRLKREVLTELPPKIRTVTTFGGGELDALARREAEMGRGFAEQQEEAAAAAELAKASGSDDEYREAVKRMRTIGTIAFEEMARVRHEMALAKVPAMIETIRERLEETQKVLVFAHHKDVLEALHNAFRMISVLVHGGHEQREREEAVDMFQRDPGCRIFFGSIRATGEGLNLTAATLVMFHEFDWVPSKMMQCEDRAHRIGQRDTVTVEVCVVNGTLDAQMAKTCLEKADLADRALDAEMAEEIRQVPTLARHESLARKQDYEVPVSVSKEQAEAIQRHLANLVSVCDGARKIDGAGFNKIDAIIGRKLASLPFLTPRQTILGAKLVLRYRRQLGDKAANIAQEILENRRTK